jgi:subtilase family serine protease
MSLYVLRWLVLTNCSLLSASSVGGKLAVHTHSQALQKGDHHMLNKMKTRLILGALLGAAIACAAPMARAAAPSNVAGWVKNAKMIGTAPGNLSVQIAVHMKLRNFASLQALAADVSSPSGKQYGQYLTTQEFGERFSPDPSDVNAVKALLERAGMSNVVLGPHGVYVAATATVNQLKATFNVSQNLYSYKGMTLRANNEEPTIPSALAGSVLFVEGLDDTGLLRQPFHKSAVQGALVAPAGVKTASVTPPPVAAGNPSPYCNTDFGPSALVATLSKAAGVYGANIPWLNCGYTPQQIQAAYGLNQVKYDGKGVTVAILDAFAKPTLLADANRYSANHDLPKLVLGKNFSQIIPAGIYGVSPSNPCGPYGWWLEQSLDIGSVHGAAPGANILYIGSTDCATSLDIAFENALYSHLADVITDSYGYDGESIAPGQQASDDQAAMAAAAEGMTVLFSSGDDGDQAANNGVASGSWPATSAWVTGVGGTSLLITDSSTGAKSEYGWGTYRDPLKGVTVNSATSVTTSGLTKASAYGYTFDAFSFYAGSGGGISLLESQPSYQALVVPEYLATSLNLASGNVETLPNPHRVSPDVAMVGDPYTGYLYGETFTIAGNPISDHGCTPISATEEYCENAEGGTSLASPLMAGVIAVMDQQREASGSPVVGFANPLFYSIGSLGNGVAFNEPLNQIVAPAEPVSVFRGYADDLNFARVVTINSVPFLIDTAPYALEVCGLPVCLGIDDVFNYTSLSSAGSTPAGYNDVTGLGVPYLPKLITEQ